MAIVNLAPFVKKFSVVLKIERKSHPASIEDGYVVPSFAAEDTIRGLIVPRSTELWTAIDAGVIFTGDAKLYCDDGQTVSNEDIIIDNSDVRWKVIEVLDYAELAKVRQYALKRET